MPFDLSELTFDVDFAQPVTVIRSRGAFAAGGWKSTDSQNINTRGIVAPSDSKMLQMIPEGDRITGAIYLITQMRIYTTHYKPQPGVPGPGLSDKVIWQQREYQVTSVTPWQDFGFNIAVLLRTAGN